MNRFLAAILTVCLVFTSIACTSQKTAPKLQTGTYIGSASYSSEEYNKTWHIQIDLNDDLTFTIVNENGEEKGAGTYTRTDLGCILTYSNGSTADPLSATLDLTRKENASHVVASSNTTVAYDETAGALALTVKGQDPHVTIVYDGAISADQYKTLEITYMLPTTNSAGNNITDLFLCAGSISNPDASASVRVTNTPDGQYHTLVIDLSDKSFWKGDVNKIRFDYLDGCAAGDVMYVKSIVLK